MRTGGAARVGTLLFGVLAMASCSGSHSAGGDAGLGGAGGIFGGGGRAGAAGTGGSAGANGTGGAGGPGGVGGAGLGTAGTGGGSGGAATGGASGTGGVAAGGRGGAAGGGGTGGGTTGGAGGAATGGAGAGGARVHDRCADPEPISFVDGRAVVSGDTTAATDELPTLDCGGLGLAGPLNGRQVYYRFPARAGMQYEFRLKRLANKGPFVYYVFPAGTCTVDAIQAACRSGGDTGTTFPATDSMFRPRVSGDYVVGVDYDGFAGAPALPGGPFTLTIFEYCGATGAAGCKTRVCAADLPVCDLNVATTCDAAGTGTTGARTDCTSAGNICYGGGCNASLSDLPGWGSPGWTTDASTAADAGTTVNFYAVSTSRTLTQIVQYMQQATAVPLTWVVYEAASQSGPYASVLSMTVTSRGAGGTESSGAISVRLVAGRYYAIGVGWATTVRYTANKELRPPAFPQTLSFGELVSAASYTTPPASTTVTYAPPGTHAFPQALTTAL